MRLYALICAEIDRQRGHLLPWVPVCLGIGIGIYFAVPAEPGPGLLASVMAAGMACLALAHRMPESLRPLFWAVALVASGLVLAAARAHLQAAPVLDFRYYGPVEGRIVEIDRSLSDKLRLTLDQVVLSRVDPDETPQRVRISLHGAQGYVLPQPGQRVIVTAHLSPPNRPPEPGGFDFQRMAWFERLGAVGYTRTPVLELAPPAPRSLGLAVHRLRLSLSAAIQDALPGQTGAFATAVTTGDRSALSRETVDAMRDTNLAHLLAISGLHMGLLTGVVFAAARLLLAMVPPLALRLPGKKIGAVVALAAGAVYLALSGAPVSTQRAFIMVSVMLAAVLMDQRALTLRAVALAAVLILVLQPEALLGAGFQMSFAATTALVWVFGAMRGGPRPAEAWLRPVVAVLMSSAIAGLATAPIAAAHFNRSAVWGLLANLLSVPVMGSVVIPAAVAAAALAPLGLQAPALWVMGKGIDWILHVADSFAGLEGAVRHIPRPQDGVLPMLVAGALVVILWQGRARVAGLVPMIAALWLWVGTERPAVLIDETGALAGVMTGDGRALNKPRGQGYAALSWLEDDGDGTDQAGAAARWPRIGAEAPLRVVVLSASALGKTAAPCAGADLLVTPGRPEVGLPCAVLDGRRLAETGAVAIWLGPEGVRVATVAERIGRRLWNGSAGTAAETPPGAAIARALETALAPQAEALAARAAQ